MLQKKLAGVLPKNQVSAGIAYDKEPERRKKVEIEEAHDGTFTIRCYGGPKSMAWDGKLLTARTWREAAKKGAEHMGAGEMPEVKGEKE